MQSQKLVESRGAEPTVLPGHGGESWQRIELGLGASILPSSPRVHEPPSPRPRQRLLTCILMGGVAAFLLVSLFRQVFR